MMGFKHRAIFPEGSSMTSLRRLLASIFVIWVALDPVNRGLASEHNSSCIARPNVVFILADDLGWSDTTLFGTTQLYRTPHVQRLARRGMTFTRAYSASPLCSPTRASILTGQSPARHGITAPVCHLPEVRLQATASPKAAPSMHATVPNSATRLDTKHVTLAEAFRDAGYATGHFGKWHLGSEPYSPLQHGFDVDVPQWPGPGPAGSYVAPWKFKDFDPDPQTPNEHIEDRMAKEAVKFMEEHQAEPFFLNYWMFSVHAPFDAKPDLIAEYRRRVDKNDEQQCPTYAAMIESMDDAVGTLLDTLDRLKLSERTIIVFASDNGGNMYNEVEGVPPTSNRPLRGGKATSFEGGIRGPCVVICPWLTEPNSTNDVIIQSCDFFPTLLELADVDVPQDLKIDGRTLVDFLQGVSVRREPIFTYFPHNPNVPDWIPPSIAVHLGPWKLIRIFHGNPDQSHRYLLFNVVEDPGETQDLSQAYPEQVAKLDDFVESHLIATNAVRPLPNPNFDLQQYDPTLEGKPRRRTHQRANPLNQVAGWREDHACQLKLSDGLLRIEATGQDPHLSFPLQKPWKAGSYRLVIALASDREDQAQFFWEEKGVTPAFFRDRSVRFQVNATQELQEYVIDFQPKHAVEAVRLDPLSHRGTVRIGSMKIEDEAGKVVYEWDLRPK
jgi:arylsulfatase A-like enzyme